jgi:ABC-type maltose transport system permease subunit
MAIAIIALTDSGPLSFLLALIVGLPFTIIFGIAAISFARGSLWPRELVLMAIVFISVVSALLIRDLWVNS